MLRIEDVGVSTRLMEVCIVSVIKIYKIYYSLAQSSQFVWILYFSLSQLYSGAFATLQIRDECVKHETASPTQ